MSPAHLFRRVAITEAVTWGLLLAGMVLKYVTETTELGVRVFGMMHGVVFIAYCVTALGVAVDQAWSARRTLAALVCGVPPFATVVFERHARSRGWLGATWRLSTGQPRQRRDRVVAWLVRHPLRGVAAAAASVVALTSLALLVGPPVG